MQHSLDLCKNIPAMLLEAALFVERNLEQNGFEVFLVGGSVRDLLLQKKISDIDFTTNATPQQVIKIFKQVIPVGIHFGTVIVLYKKIPIEVTTFRSENNYSDGRHPDKIIFGSSLEEDIQRRDFTVNGLAYHLEKKILYDFCGGWKDIQEKKLRTIGKAEERFAEDGLRAIRACRFAASSDFKVDRDMYRGIQNSLSKIQGIATERFHDEWKKSLKAENPFLFWNYLFEFRIFSLFFFSLKELNLQTNKKNLLLKILSNSKKNNISFQAASMWLCEIYDSKEKFLNLEKQKQKICNDLKKFFDFHRFSLQEKKQIEELIFSPFLNLLNQTSEKFNRLTFKKVLSKLANEKNLIQNRQKIFFHLSFFSSTLPYFLEEEKSNLQKYFQKILEHIKTILKEPITISQLDINGNDLQKINLNGKQIGFALQDALNFVLENPSKNKKQILLSYIKTRQ